ncbi:MAG TPA: low molecular weight protein-tyrosine-phosphatase [Mycobacteriales bacterium]|nr:low molecular weight protein-tyrosine-phosphatase [Mycobacteriales bacterium]
METPYRICFVCMGNICRSPIAEVVMRAKIADAGLADRVVVDSAGTGDWHAGGPADERTIATLRAHGYDGERHVARQFKPEWFDGIDLVVAMDGRNLQALRWLASDEQSGKIVRLRSFDPAARGGDLDVPDPYYGAADHFEEVLAMVEAGCDGLLAHVRATLE